MVAQGVRAVLAEDLQFARAAERLHVAQPALSQQVRFVSWLGAQHTPPASGGVMTVQVTLFKSNGVVTRDFQTLALALAARRALADAGAIGVISRRTAGALRFPKLVATPVTP
jgi:Bacterial regulatory helix-turn-helix protein, lysR family